jgi:hypothetical protein
LVGRFRRFFGAGKGQHTQQTDAEQLVEGTLHRTEKADGTKRNNPRTRIALQKCKDKFTSEFWWAFSGPSVLATAYNSTKKPPKQVGRLFRSLLGSLSS